MDLTKDTTYKQLNNLKFKPTKEENFLYNDLLGAVLDSDILLSISPKKIRCLKNRHGCTGSLGTGELLNVMISILYESLDSDVKLFKESFLEDLYRAVRTVLKNHKLDVDAHKFFNRRSTNEDSG